MVLTFLTYMLVCCAEPFPLWNQPFQDKNLPCWIQPIQAKNLPCWIEPAQLQAQVQSRLPQQIFSNWWWLASFNDEALCVHIYIFKSRRCFRYHCFEEKEERMENAWFAFFHIQYLGNIIAFVDPLWQHYKALWTPAFLVPLTCFIILLLLG